MLLTIFVKEFLDCLTLKLKALQYLETSVTTQTRRHIPVGHHKRNPDITSYNGSTVLMGQVPIIVEVLQTYSDTSKSVDPSGRVIDPSQRTLPNNTHHSQDPDIHSPPGIRTRNPGKRVASDPRHRLLRNWNRHLKRAAKLMWQYQHYFIKPSCGQR